MWGRSRRSIGPPFGRSVRAANEQLKKLLKEKEISEDDEHRGLEDVQRLTDSFIEKIDALARQKEEEILEV